MSTSELNFIERLEDRRLLSTSVALIGSVLEIRGDAGDDVVTASTPKGDPQMYVTLNGKTQSFPAAEVKSVLIETYKGYDSVTLGGGFWRPTTIKLGGNADYCFAGGKNDVIYAGKGRDKVNASAGNDTIYGEGGDDVLEGAENSDTVYGGLGDDVMGGHDGYNLLYGEDGNDTLYAVDAGRGKADGGAGTDCVWCSVGMPEDSWEITNSEDVN